MDEFKIIKAKKRNLKTLFSIIVVLLIYLGFRLTLGGNIVNAVDGYVNNSLLTILPSGITLSEIQATKYEGLADIRSNVSSDISASYLRGSTGLQTSNPKILAMRKFLLDYNSPMYGYADVLVEQADKTGLDWRLVASISGVESAFGNLIPPGSSNGWGWRGGPAGAYSIFPTWKEGISTVTQRLAKGYGTDLTPFDIEPVYCPPCYANPAHAWANGVTRFMSELSFYLENLDKI